MEKNERNPYIVFFAHSGGEHIGGKINWKKIKDNDSIMSWNRDTHRRKFIKCKGKYLDISESNMLAGNFSGEVKPGELLFWGEMEYSTFVQKINYTDAERLNDERFPKYLHSPIAQKKIDFENKSDEELYKLYGSYIEENGIITSDRKMGYQNTDPYVFGDTFHYCCCQQNKKSKANKLQRLLPGDVIIFYSRKKKGAEYVFRIDTVFVVGEKIGKYKKGELENIKNRINELYMQNVILPVFYGNGGSVSTDGEFTLYKAATFENPVNGMFSYFPCRIYENDENCGFKRFELDNGYITEDYQIKSSQGHKLGETKSKEIARSVWSELTKKVINDGYYLGIYAEEPDFE